MNFNHHVRGKGALLLLILLFSTICFALFFSSLYLFSPQVCLQLRPVFSHLFLFLIIIRNH